MIRDAHQERRSHAVVAFRVAWTVVSLVVLQSVVCGISVMPLVIGWRYVWPFVSRLHPLVQGVLISVGIVPTYVAFALCVIVVSPLGVRLVGWHTPPDAEMRIADMGWPLLGWARYCASIHVARIVAGTLFRGTPIWTLHVRLHGARVGKRVYVNSLGISDYNLLECGDDVVIGGGVHLSGHTVEAGVVKTARVRLGNNVTIGLNSVIEIGVTVGSNCQVGALSFVPKHAELKGGIVYAGAPAMPIE